MKKNNIIFNISLLLTSVVVILGLVAPTMFKNISNKGFNIVVNNFNWVYLIVMLALVIFVGFLIFSKYGNIRLVKDTDRPEFRNLSWLSMLFGAGMGTMQIADGLEYMLGMFTSDGDLNPSNKKKITWCIIQALLALVILMSGGLETLQTVSIVSAFPFAIIMIMSIVSITKALKAEFRDEIEIKKDFEGEKEGKQSLVKIQ